MPFSPKPRSSACCKRGYWNAIAFGAAVLWVIPVVLNFLRTVLFMYSETVPMESQGLDNIYFFTAFRIHSPAMFWVNPVVQWITTIALPLPYNTAPLLSDVMFNVFFHAIVYAPQWIVFLGVLRAYWWLRRAPVTGRSALEAIFVMVTIIVVSHLLISMGWYLR